MRAFWLLIFVLLLAAMLTLAGMRNRASSTPRFDAGRPSVIEDPVLPEEVPPEKTVTAAPASTDYPTVHSLKVAPKVLAVNPEDGGTVEREDGPRLVRMQDGSVIVDRYWILPGGDGSAEHPYQLSWDLLLSAQNTSQPGAAVELPERVKMLSGKHVVIKGNTVKTVVGAKGDEFLLNDQLMDNCPTCINRTIYATIAVKVKTPEAMDAGVINILTLRGKFKAEPYLKNGFLIGVYFLEDAEVVTRGQ
jgi:hypothetical protein